MMGYRDTMPSLEDYIA